MIANKAKILLSSILSLSVVATVIGTITFSWFNFNKNFENSIITTSGDIQITDTTLVAYKYSYPTYSGSEYIDYGSKGSVSETTLTETNISMNIYDPFYLALYPSYNVTDLFTNIVYKFQWTVKVFSDASIKLLVLRDTNDSNYTAVTSSTNFNDNTIKIRTSDYMDFYHFDKESLTDDATLNSLTSYTSIDPNVTDSEDTSITTLTKKRDISYYSFRDNEKEYLDSTVTDKPVITDTFITSGTPKTYSLEMFTSDIDFSSSTVTKEDDGSKIFTFTKFISADYNQASLINFSSYITSDQLIPLSSDFYFEIRAEQK